MLNDDFASERGDLRKSSNRPLTRLPTSPSLSHGTKPATTTIWTPPGSIA